MSKKKIIIIIAILVVLIIGIVVGIKIFSNNELYGVEILDNGGIAFSDMVDTTITRKKLPKLSEEIEKYIKETYGYDVKVKSIGLGGSGASALYGHYGVSPAEIGSTVTVAFEENEYIDYMRGRQMFSFEPKSIPGMNVITFNTEGVIFNEDGSINFDISKVHRGKTNINRSRIIKLSEEIEKHIKETYGFKVRVSNIKIIFPTPNYSYIDVYFEANEDVAYMRKSPGDSITLEEIPNIYVQLQNK